VEYLFRFAYPIVLYVLLPVLAVLLLLHLKKKHARYRYALGSELQLQGFAKKRHPYKKILFVLRFLSLVILALLIARPQLVDPQSTVKVEGINIMIALDVSGSMGNWDDEKNKQTRIGAAKKEAIRFINKRDNDAIGLVLFANETVSRCPLTLDKKILNQIIDDIEINVLDPDGTLLAKGLLTAINRLAKAKGKTNIAILLTDGVPSAEDIAPEAAIETARQLGIKVYTVGIGSERPQRIMHPLYGLLELPGLNKKLLQDIAQQTGGRFFLASSSGDMRTIYDTIDKLEKVEQEQTLFSRYQELMMPFLWLVLLFVGLEILLSSLIWFSL